MEQKTRKGVIGLIGVKEIGLAVLLIVIVFVLAIVGFSIWQVILDEKHKREINRARMTANLEREKIRKVMEGEAYESKSKD